MGWSSKWGMFCMLDLGFRIIQLSLQSRENIDLQKCSKGHQKQGSFAGKQDSDTIPFFVRAFYEEKNQAFFIVSKQYTFIVSYFGIPFFLPITNGGNEWTNLTSSNKSTQRKHTRRLFFFFFRFPPQKHLHTIHVVLFTYIFMVDFYRFHVPGTPFPTICKWMEMVISNHFLH